MEKRYLRVFAWMLMLCLIVGFLPMQPARGG